MDEVFKEWITAIELAKLGVFTLSGLVGVGMHFYKKRLRQETRLSLRDYFIGSNCRATLNTGIAFVAASAGVMATGIISSAEFSHVVGLGFTTGYMMNSAFNKAEET